MCINVHNRRGGRAWNGMVHGGSESDDGRLVLTDPETNTRNLSRYCIYTDVIAV